MDQQITTAGPANGASTPRDLFALTDEQILEIEPEATEAPPVEQPLLAVQEHAAEAQAAKTSLGAAIPAHAVRNDASQNTQAGVPMLPEPPAWLAAQMKDPWSGEEAKELWNGVQQAKQEAAAYREAFATPEDARALKELHPGGVNEARAAASRARLLDDIDRAYFGAAGGTPEQIAAARTQLAAMMLREDPAAFREMVFAGLRALEEAEKGSGTSNLPRFAQVFDSNRAGVDVAPPFRAASFPVETSAQRGDAGFQPGIPAGATSVPLAANAASGTVSSVGAQHAAPLPGTAATSEAHVAAYAAFEKAANEDLERSVGAVIARTIDQALPNLSHTANASSVGARQAAPLQARLSAAVRQDVEVALKGDRQLGEQIAQILSARRFNHETRAQVVRLIDDRARQLVPVAAKRVLNDWTQTTLAAHRGDAARADASSTRREVEPASSDSGRASLAANSPRSLQTRTGTNPNRGAMHPDSRRVDYRKLSDEQILEL